MPPNRCLYLVASAAPPVLHIADFITTLHQDNWQVCLIPTPTAATWIDLDRITATTGCLARTTARQPGENDPLPPADAILVAPLTFNTLNKWATGINDSLALGILNELLTTGTPIIAAPCIKPALRAHPAYTPHHDRLAQAGVTIHDPDTITTRHASGMATFTWIDIHAALRHRTRTT